MLVTIKPARSGLILRDPDDGYSLVPDDGKQVVSSVYWQRRIDDGDAVLADATQSSAADSAASNSASQAATSTAESTATITTAATGGAS